MSAIPISSWLNHGSLPEVLESAHIINEKKNADIRSSEFYQGSSGK